LPEADRTGGDSRLAQAMQQYPVILSSVGADKNKNSAQKFGLIVIGPYDAPIPTYSGIIANVPPLEKSAVGIGTTNTLPEIDGVNRRMPLLTQVEDGTGKFIFPSLSMEILRVAAGDTTQQVKLNEYGVETKQGIYTTSKGKTYPKYRDGERLCIKVRGKKIEIENAAGKKRDTQDIERDIKLADIH
jgi:adenylate cyclase